MNGTGTRYPVGSSSCDRARSRPPRLLFSALLTIRETLIAAPATASATGPVPTVLTARESRLIWLLLAAAFVAILNETTMGIAIPFLMEDLRITEVTAQWLTTAFMLTMAVVIPITGFLLQRFTTRQVFVAAMSLFASGTLIALVAPGFEVLLIARVVQAGGTAIMMPLLMTTLMTVVPPAIRGRMMGRVSIVMSLAPAIGPTLSGFLLGVGGWRANFAVVLPIAVIALIAGARWVVSIGDSTHAPIDVLSVVLSALGFGGLVFGLSQIGGEGEGSSTLALVLSLVVGGIGLALFLWRQAVLQRTGVALLDLRVFRHRNFSLVVIQLALLSMAFFGTITVLPLYLQNVLHHSPLEAGLAVLPGAILMGLAGPVIGRIYDRVGTRPLLIPGAVLAAGTLWFFAAFFDGNTSIITVAIAQTVLSVALAMSFTPLFTAGLGALPRRLYSYGSAVVGTVQQVAGAAGIAVMFTVMSAVRHHQLADGATELAAGAAGSQAAFLIGGIVAIPLIVLACFIRKPEDESAPADPPVPGGH